MKLLEVLVTVSIAGGVVGNHIFDFGQEVQQRVIETSEAIYQAPKCYKARDFKCTEAREKLIELSEGE